MKLIKNSIYALSMLSVMGLWSCSNDEMLPGGADLKGHPVTLTLTVNRGDAQTRTILSENSATGGLNDVWESGDKLAVYNADGDKAGELVIDEGVGTDTGVFTGEVTATDGQHDFNLWYTNPAGTGKVEADGKPIYFNNKKRLVVDLSKMPKYTSAEDLSAMDVLSKGVKLNIKGNEATVVESTTMNAHLAMARFSLNGLPSGKTGTLTISDKAGSVNGDGLHETLYKLQLGLSNSEIEATTSRPQGIVVNEVRTGEDIYLAFIPGTYTLAFNIKIDGINYDYAFTNPTKLEAGVYYNAFTKAEGAEEGVIDGVNIPLQQEVMARLHLNANFDGADPKEIVIVKPFVDGAATFDLTQDYGSYRDSSTAAALPVREGYTFKYWAANDDGSDKAQDAVTINSPSYPNQYYYAVWEKNEDPTITNNPGNMGNWGGDGEAIPPVGTPFSPVFASVLNGWTLNAGNSYDVYGGYCRAIEYTNGKTADGMLTSQGLTCYYYQWGRFLGFPSNCATGNTTILNASGVDIFVGYRGKGGVPVKYLAAYMGNSEAYNVQRSNDWAIVFGQTNNYYYDYIYGNSNNGNWYERSVNPAPSGYRIPTAEELYVFIPSTEEVNGSYAEVKTINGVKYAMKWVVGAQSGISYVDVTSVPTSSNSVSVSSTEFNSEKASTQRIYAYGYLMNNGKPSGFGDTAIYWSSDSGEQNAFEDKGGIGGKALYIEFEGTTALFDKMNPPFGFGAPVMLIKDASAVQGSLKPWLPYSWDYTALPGYK